MVDATKSMSVIIPSLNEGANLEDTVLGMIGTTTSSDYEVIVINSGGTEVSRIRDLKSVFVFDSATRLSPAQAKNAGATKASGEILLFADAHLSFQDGWDERLLDDCRSEDGIVSPCITRMGDEEEGGCGFMWSGLDMKVRWLPVSSPGLKDIPFAGGACMAIRKKTFDGIDRFDPDNRSWGMEDAEISLRAWTLGRRVTCDSSVRVAHKFRTAQPYTVSWKDLHYNRMRLCFIHFGSERLAKYIKHVVKVPDFDATIREVLGSDVLERRDRIFERRVHDDDWFFERFPMRGWSSRAR